MGIEFAYAAETAFVSPTLLKIGKDDEVSFIFKLKTSFPEKDRVFTLLEFQDKKLLNQVMKYLKFSNIRRPQKIVPPDFS